MPDNVETTVIGRDARIVGEIFDAGLVRVLGSFQGRIASVGDLHIGTGASCDATIEAERVVVDGTVHGDITASDVLTLEENAKVEGDIVAGTLVVMDGASYIGNCRVGSNGKSTKGSNAPSKKRIKLVPTEAPQARQIIEGKPGRVERSAAVDEAAEVLRLNRMDAAS